MEHFLLVVGMSAFQIPVYSRTVKNVISSVFHCTVLKKCRIVCVVVCCSDESCRVD